MSRSFFTFQNPHNGKDLSVYHDRCDRHAAVGRGIICEDLSPPRVAVALLRGLQNGKPLARPARRQIVGTSLALIDGFDARTPGAFSTGLDHAGYHGSRCCEYRFDRAVATVADPAFETTRERFVLDKSAIADALHAAANDHVPAGGFFGGSHRPGSAGVAPRQAEGDQRASSAK